MIDWQIDQHDLICGKGKKRERGENEEEEDRVVTLSKDAMSVVLKFLELDDLKEVSLASKKMTQLARAEMVRSYWWVFTPEVVQFVKPIKVFINRPNYSAYVDYILNSGTTHIRDVWFRSGIFETRREIVLPINIRHLRLNDSSFNLINQDGLDLSRYTELESVRFLGLANPVNVFNARLILPPSVKRLRLGRDFDSDVNLPDGLESLILGNIDRNIVFPPNLLRLELGRNFNRQIVLPARLREFTTGRDFNQPVILPETIVKVQFGRNFNQPVIFPSGVKFISFGANFHQNVTIPEGTERIFFKDTYRHTARIGRTTVIIV